MDIKQRKPNRLKNFNYGQNGSYFITLCTKERKKILSTIVGDDAHIVPSKCGKIIEKHIKNVPEIKKYVIMPDHIHMIIELNNGTMWASSSTNKIPNTVRTLKILTTKELRQSIFQRSYYDHVIRNQDDYNIVWEYIENNPKKWILANNKTQGD